MNAMVAVKDLKKTFNEGKDYAVQALRGVDLEINRGEFVAIIGPSGSGKSTLMHIIGALDSPSAGSVQIDGQEIGNRKISKLYKLRANRIGFVFQGFNLLPTLTALENVMLAVDYSGRKADVKREAIEVLEQVGLGGRIRHYPSELSGGEQQRVAIARALVNRPALVLADEPTGQLDTRNSVEIVQLMKRLCHENRQTFVVVTHNPEVARECDRIIILRDGQIVQPSHPHYEQLHRHIRHSVSTDNVLVLPAEGADGHQPLLRTGDRHPAGHPVYA